MHIPAGFGQQEARAVFLGESMAGATASNVGIGVGVRNAYGGKA